MKVRVQVDGQSYEVEIGDLNSRPIQVLVDGELFAVWPEEVAGVVDQPDAGNAGEAQAGPAGVVGAEAADQGDVLAPLPGDIVSISVRPGDRVEPGQLLCTVESMKMNNPVRSAHAGVVDELYIAVGEHVTHGQRMIRLRQA